MVRERLETLLNLPGGHGRFWMGGDLGYTNDPTELLLFEEDKDEELSLVLRVHAEHVAYWRQYRWVCVALFPRHPGHIRFPSSWPHTAVRPPDRPIPGRRGRRRAPRPACRFPDRHRYSQPKKRCQISGNNSRRPCKCLNIRANHDSSMQVRP